MYIFGRTYVTKYTVFLRALLSHVLGELLRPHLQPLHARTLTGVD